MGNPYAQFQQIVRGLGGVWATKHVRFSKTQSVFTAEYAPMYPAQSPEDSVINKNQVCGCWYYRGPHTANIQHY